jgi:hypothetical protein
MGDRNPTGVGKTSCARQGAVVFTARLGSGGDGTPSRLSAQRSEGTAQ